MSVAQKSIDQTKLAKLIETEEAEFNGRHPGSRKMTERAHKSLAGGVASSWQATEPHPIYLADGYGSKVIDVDGNEYVDFHNGYGAVAVGHAHPRIAEVVSERIKRGSHFAQPTEDAVICGEHLQQRFGLPLWRFCNSGTEATMDAVRLMRAIKGRDILLKIEGSYHGHGDAVMVSVAPPADKIGPYDDPVSVPQTIGIPAEVTELTRVVPFNDLDALERTLQRYKGRVAGMIVEPAMMNAGFVLPDDGYLAGVKERLHAADALLAFDEVKTGATIAYGGAVERFGVTPDLLCLAKSVGGGLPCGAIGGSDEVMDWIASGKIDQVGTFNGNPLTMAAMRATLTEILTHDAYTEFDRLAEILKTGCDGVMERTGIQGYTTVKSARGAVTYRGERVRNYRDYLEVSDELGYINWLVQLNRGVFMAPWGKSENWTLSVQHSEADVRRYVDNFEELGEGAGFMKAVVFEEHGGPEVLSYTDIPDPEPKPFEVLIEVRAAGANFNDIWARRGMPGMKVIFPHVAGSDVAGVVRAVGSDVGGTGFGSSPVKVGDEVVVHPGLSCRTCEMCTSGQEFFCRQFLIWGFQTGPNNGGHSELVTMPAVNVLPKPANLTFEEAASMPLVLETAWRMLVTRARIQAGEHVLIWGGVGGLGVMAIQICRLFGAIPIPVVGGAAKVAKAQELGAEHVIDRSSEDVAARVREITRKVGADVVFEHSGQDTWPTSMAAMRWGGRLVVCGASTGFEALTDLRFLWNKQQNLLGSHLASKAELAAALRAVEAGHIKPVIDHVFPLHEVGKAQQLMEDLKVQGKLVYVP